ncbi:hypothetical protein V7S43_015599 [Phytophthora oleae]|uniref:Uncharacterized protein n=1 Tax=Phytophthora oleae TaxID=2107226 RepID=A0ABD3EXX7_9STRA
MSNPLYQCFLNFVAIFGSPFTENPGAASRSPNPCSNFSCNHVDYCLAILKVHNLALFVVQHESFGEGSNAKLVAGAWAAKSLANSKITCRMIRYRKAHLRRDLIRYERFLGQCWLAEQRGEVVVGDRAAAAQRITDCKKVIESIELILGWLPKARSYGWHDARWNTPGMICFHFKMRKRRIGRHDSTEVKSHALSTT